MEIHPYFNINGFKEQLQLSESEIINEKFKEGGIWDEKTETIICGTFPPKKEYLDRQGYIHYSSPKNKFWSHIDAIYNTEYYINTAKAKNVQNRIQNALKKIKFLKDKKIGFVDIYSKIDRKKDSSKDVDLISIETIFENGIFDNILKSNVNQIAFVYSLSKKEFEKQIKKNYNVKFSLVREYRKDNITLKVEKINIENKTLYLSYSPTMGNISDSKRRPALKKVIENDLS